MADDARTRIAQQFFAAIPHCKELGMEMVSLGDGEAVGKIPYDARLIGDPATGVLHGGVVTALLDSVAGAAVMSHPTGAGRTATLDLRIDYMRPAAPGETLFAHAVCHTATRSVAFVTARAYHEGQEAAVATATGAFTLERPKSKAAS